MKEGNVNEYIAQFASLVHRAGMEPNDPSTLRLFAQGLLKGLADSCIDIESPETFVEWTKAAQRHHRNWLKKQSIHRDYASPSQNRQPQRGAFFWNRSNNQGNNNRNNPRGAPPRAPQCDPNAMNTSATVQWATTEAEKEKARKEGRCFECGK